jgi:hypothetical protein
MESLLIPVDPPGVVACRIVVLKSLTFVSLTNRRGL